VAATLLLSACAVWVLRGQRLTLVNASQRLIVVTMSGYPHARMERKESSSTTEIIQVQNVALADATAKAGVSAWTSSMFKVTQSCI